MRKGRPCSICVHKNRCQIDEEYLKTTDIRGVARKFRVSEDALGRHISKGHISKAIQAAANEKAIQTGLDIQKCAKEIYDLCFGAAQDARGKDLRALGSCIAPAVKVLEILNKGDPEGKPPEAPKESGFIKGYMNRAEEVYAKSPPN